MKLLPKNILAIDDSLTLRKFIEKALVSEDCVKHLLLASDWSSGLDLAIKNQPDLIICDYTLPEIKGDELCRRLAAAPETSRIPVILMSGSAPEMSHLSLEGTNIVRLLVKPFSKELLIATVSYVLNHWEQQLTTQEAASSAGEVLMRGNTDASTISHTLRYIEKENLTGVLRVRVNDTTIHTFCVQGSVRLVTTRDVEEYLKDSPFLSHGRKSSYWKKCEETQRETLSPFLMNLSQEGILPSQTARTLTLLYGHRLFSRIWITHGMSYEFERVSSSSFVEHFPPQEKRMDEWIMASLRNVQNTEEITTIFSDPHGVPFFTPEGYRDYPRITPHQAERRIMALINGRTQLGEIYRKLNVTDESVARVIYRYKRLGFLDFWPSFPLENRS